MTRLLSALRAMASLGLKLQAIFNFNSDPAAKARSPDWFSFVHLFVHFFGPDAKYYDGIARATSGADLFFEIELKTRRGRSRVKVIFLQTLNHDEDPRMNRTSHVYRVAGVFLWLMFSTSTIAWDVLPTQLSGTESQSVEFDVVIGADEWSAAGTVCNASQWDFEFQLDGILMDGSAEWGVDLSSPFAGSTLTGICSNTEEEVITPYTIAMIEDFTPEDTEQAQIFFEHCEDVGEGALNCSDITLTVQVVEVAGGGLPAVGIEEVRGAAEPVTDGRFNLFLQSPAPNGGVTVFMQFGGSATAGDDYVALTGAVFIPEGSSLVTVDVEVINDGLIEGTETILISLLEDTDYSVLAQHARITMMLEDDDSEGDQITINQGISDAWFNPDTPGQGFFIIVLPDIGKIFLAWFTYDTERPPGSVSAILGDAGHRWMTAFGSFSGDTATLDIEITEGGVFNVVPPNTSQSVQGTIVLEFIDCDTGLVHFNIPSLGLSGTIPIQRLSNDNIALCESQNAGP